MSEIIFELKDVYYSYLGKFPALCAIDMTVAQGEKIAVIGANGTGKSTLLHLLDGLIFPDRGESGYAGLPGRFGFGSGLFFIKLGEWPETATTQSVWRYRLGVRT